MPVVATTMPFRTSRCPFLPRQCLSRGPDARCCDDNAFPDVRMPVVATTMPFRTSTCPLLPQQCLSGRPDARFCHDNPFPDVRMPVFGTTTPFRKPGFPFLSGQCPPKRFEARFLNKARWRRVQIVARYGARHERNVWILSPLINPPRQGRQKPRLKQTVLVHLPGRF